MIELVARIDSQMTACWQLMQSIGYRVAPSILAAGAKKSIVLDSS